MTPNPAQDPPAVLRTSARLLLIDETDRLLLFSSTDDSDGHTFWCPIGGGREAGETLEQTAAREAREETGLTELPLGPEVWRRRAFGTWGGTTYDCREHFFLVRVDKFDIDTTGFTEDERISITGHRWWTLDELNATSDRLVPADLGSLLADLLISGPPDEPITLTM
ncbi:NUDIX domain-containing protein [Nocardia sp. NPDC050710]|uniref:NUDIX hydrolase n=1 Tax=Nocardia sp. NPDC050710 TaxID=3157220 RepID=UPI003405DEDB